MVNFSQRAEIENLLHRTLGIGVTKFATSPGVRCDNFNHWKKKLARAKGRCPSFLFCAPSDKKRGLFSMPSFFLWVFFMALFFSDLQKRAINHKTWSFVNFLFLGFAPYFDPFFVECCPLSGFLFALFSGLDSSHLKASTKTWNTFLFKRLYLILHKSLIRVVT